MDISDITTNFPDRELAQRITQVCDEVLRSLTEMPVLSQTQTDELRLAVEKLGTILVNPDQINKQDDSVSDIGQLGLQTLSEYIQLDIRYLQGANQEDLNLYSSAFCFWIVRQEGTILALDLAVNSLAFIANRVQDPNTLGWLSDEIGRVIEAETIAARESATDVIAQIGRVIEAVPDSLRHSSTSNLESEPWQVLNLNRSIIATRSHDTERMQEAFERLITLLPNDACHFFKQGLEQMDIVGYPDPVRQIMLQYYTRSCEPQQLH